MNKYKITVYAICKNEEENIIEWYESMKEADEIIVLDTGSTDDSIKMLKKCPKIKVYRDTINPWRFDKARNKSLSLVSKDTDICVCVDLDERFEPKWREKIEKVWKNNTTRARYLYNWSLDERGNPGTTFFLNKIHSRNDYEWVNPVHEILKCKTKENEVLASGVVLNHYQKYKESRKDYLNLLELSVSENPNDDRNMHYLGREYMYYGMWDKCIETLHKHLKLKTSTWKDERSASMRFIARCYNQKKYLEEAELWYKKAIEEAPYLREPYTELGIFYYYENKNNEAKEILEKALKIKDKPKTYINEKFAWDETIDDILSIIYYHEKNYKKALKHSKKAYIYNPNNERVEKNYNIIKNIDK